MNPFKSAVRRLAKAVMLVVVVIGGGVFGLYKTRVDVPFLNTPKIYARLDSMGVRANHLKESVVSRFESFFHKNEEAVQPETHKVVVTSPMAKDVVITQDYVCQIHSQNHIDVKALESGYLEAISIKEGQAVKAGQVMFKVVPVLYKAKWDAEVAEQKLASLELAFTESLQEKQGVSKNEVELFKAKLAKAQAKADLAEAELNFATVRAPFDGIIDRLKLQKGSLVKEGDILTTLSDNSVMWVYFNVTEKRYLEYMAELGRIKQGPDVEPTSTGKGKFPQIGKIELMLANHAMFPQIGAIGAIESNFNNTNGNIAFRADFPNPDGLLRHGQTGTVLISRMVKGAVVIPQRATFENLAKRYVYVVDKDDVAHQREIAIKYVLEDIFVIEAGLDVNDKIVLEGTRQVRDGEKVEFEFLPPEDAMKNQKNHAE